MVDSDSPTLPPQNMWKRIGFMRHAYEFWLLANLILDRISSQATISEYGIGLPSREQDTLTQSVLPEYDQNNMRQVNELIG